MQNPPQHSGSQLHYPVGNVFIVLSLLAALFLNGLPWEGVWLMLRPDFVGLVLLYWCMHKPWRIGVGMAWMIGILADVADASLFGQHALAYALLGFGGVVLHRRLQMFSLRHQTTQVFGILLLTYAIYALVNWQVNGTMVWGYFLGCLTSTLLWIPLSMLFQTLRQLRLDGDSRA